MRSFLPALAILVLLGLVILLPFLDRNPERRPRKRPICVAIGIVAILALVLLGLAGHYSEREVRIFGTKYHVDHYGIPHRAAK